MAEGKRKGSYNPIFQNLIRSSAPGGAVLENPTTEQQLLAMREQRTETARGVNSAGGRGAKKTSSSGAPLPVSLVDIGDLVQQSMRPVSKHCLCCNI